MAMTSRQFEVLEFIKKYIASNGYAPTVREIASGLDLKSPSSAQELIGRLVRNGLITVNKNKSRTIELLVENEFLNNQHGLVKVPYLQSEEDAVPRSFVDVPAFMLGRITRDNVVAYKKDNSIFLVNKASKKKGGFSLIKREDNFIVTDEAQEEILGNIIGELKQY